jgi:protein TonB
MRAWTLGVSIVVHVGFITCVIVAPLFATDELPVPPHVTEFIRVFADIPQPPAPPRVPVPRPSPDAAPIQVPDAVTPEVPREPAPITDVAAFAVDGGPDAAGIFVTGDTPGGALIPPPPQPPPIATPPPAPVRVGGAIRAPQKIRDVAPRYPVIAQQSKVQGLVILEAVISEEGAVESLRVLRSQPLLDAAAVEAVRQWRFTPTMLNGQPVPVVMTVTVNFTLSQ